MTSCTQGRRLQFVGLFHDPAALHTAFAAGALLRLMLPVAPRLGDGKPTAPCRLRGHGACPPPSGDPISPYTHGFKAAARPGEPSPAVLPFKAGFVPAGSRRLAQPRSPRTTQRLAGLLQQERPPGTAGRLTQPGGGDSTQPPPCTFSSLFMQQRGHKAGRRACKAGAKEPRAAHCQPCWDGVRGCPDPRGADLARTPYWGEHGVPMALLAGEGAQQCHGDLQDVAFCSLYGERVHKRSY